MKTFSTRPSDVRREWHVIDATGQSLGRLSTQVATYLRGKHKPIYTPHLDVGDFVIVVNAANVRLTGRKLEQKRYYHHSQYPGGMKVREVKHELARRPEWVVERAVRGMLPKGPLGLHLFRHLKVYGGATHPHEAQVNAPPPAPFKPGPPGSNAPNARAVRAEAPTVVAAPPAEPLLPAPEAEPALPEPAPASDLPAQDSEAPESQA